MKTFTFRVTQESKGYFEGTVEIAASSEKAALNKLKKMSQEKLENLAEHSWTVGDGYNEPVGKIEIQECTDDGNF